MSTIDLDRATRLIQFAELDVARYLTDPAEYNTIEYMESIQIALSEALTMLGADPLPIHEGDDYAE